MEQEIMETVMRDMLQDLEELKEQKQHLMRLQGGIEHSIAKPIYRAKAFPLRYAAGCFNRRTNGLFTKCYTAGI